jgi:hypothetical protein
MSTTIEKLRAQCRIDIDDTTEDESLMLYYGAARRRAENFINRNLYEDEVPETDPDGLVIADDILLALMLLVGHWYENRKKLQMRPRPAFPSAYSLIEPYRYIPL